jgi:hypothetical protein
MNTRNFFNDLAMSDQPKVVDSIKLGCHEYWPELLNVHKAHVQNDKLGCDYWLEFPNCKQETLDVKVRKSDYSVHPSNPDDRTACLELLSNVDTGKVGWTLDADKRTDWVMFFYIDTGKAFFYNARQLRSAVAANLSYLKLTGKPSVQSTGNYKSTSLFVSHRELGKVIYLHSQMTTNAVGKAA